MSKKILKFIERLFIPKLEKTDFCQLKNNKPIIDINIRVLDQYIDNTSSIDDFFVEPEERFYKKPVSQQAEIIKRKIGLSSEYCPISFRSERSFLGMPGSAGTFVQKKTMKPLVDLDNKSIQWAQDDTLRFEIRLDPDFRDNPIIIAGLLAHELTHLYFNKKGLSGRLGDYNTEEHCCDLAIFLLGLGKIAINSLTQQIEQRDYAGITTKSIRNYWSWFEMCYVYEKVNLIKGIPANISRSNLNRAAKDGLAVVTNYSELFNN